MLDIIASATGAILGALLIINALMAMAGARFSTTRQIVVAYCAATLALVCISAIGHSDGGPPDFRAAGLHALGAVAACFIQIALLLRRQPRFLPKVK